MRWLNFLQNKTETEVLIKEISFSEAEILIQQEFNKEEENIKEVKNKINKKVNEFILLLNEKINILNLIDLKDRKEHERLKVITLQNLDKYVDLLKRLISDIEIIDVEIKIHLLFEKVNLAIDRLGKSSHKIFDRATILIGEELKQTEEVIRTFYKEINQMSSENIKTNFKIKYIEELENLKGSHSKIKKIQDEINSLILNLKKEDNEAKIEISKKEKELGLFKASEKFKGWKFKKERLKSEMENFNKDAVGLKEKINFKSLLKEFHTFPKKHELIKNYQNDFLGTLTSDEEFVIIQMLDSHQKDLIGDKIKKIKEKDLHLKKENELYIANEEVNNLEMIVKKINFEMLQSRSKIIEEDKKLEKFNEREISLRENIVEVMEKILGSVKIIKQSIVKDINN